MNESGCGGSSFGQRHFPLYSLAECELLCRPWLLAKGSALAMGIATRDMLQRLSSQAACVQTLRTADSP
jgi:hypothetical protein